MNPAPPPQLLVTESGGTRHLPDPAPTWRPSSLLWAPHRLAFVLAMAVLGLSALWWATVHGARAGWWPHPALAVAPTLTHAGVMTFGFFPLFFSGFLFTAGPKWLNVPPPSARDLLPPLLLQGMGWAGWVTGSLWYAPLAWAGGTLGVAGWAWATGVFWRLRGASAVADRTHATWIALGNTLGVLCLGGMLAYGWADNLSNALLLARLGLWLGVASTFLVVAHRMLPFFTSSALPFIEAWRPMWVLWLMLATVGLQALALVIPALLGVTTSQTPAPHGAWHTSWLIGLGTLELTVGAVMLWLAVVWGLVQSLKVRLLGMLHIGFVWFGLSLVLSGAANWLGAVGGNIVLPLGALHALTMGFLGSIMMAMVTRVSCGHGGRTLVASDTVWTLFLVLQAATVMRVAAALQATPPWLMTLAALAWALAVAPWAVHLGNWYGRPRADGRSG